MNIFLLILGVVLSCALVGFGVDAGAEYTGMHKKAAIQHAQGFINDNNMKVQSLTCSESDGDGDGFIPCTFIMEDKSTQKFECDGYHLFGGDDICEAHNEIAITQE